MRTPTLQYLYLQKPITMVIVICIISVLPWIGLGDFSTKGEPREAAVAVSMLETGNWVLPQVYANEFAYKPPLAHWLMAAASLPQGYVSEFTSRLPSALAFIILIGFTLVFFGKRLRFQQAFIATLLLITCIEIHRAAMTTRVDMLLTTFIVIGLYQLYRWEDKLELKGVPIAIPALLGCAVLTKGPVGIILPLFVFGVYLLMLRKYSYLVIFKALLYAGISSIFLPLLWYVAAWKQGGDTFLNVMLAENFGRFFHLSTPDIHYNLGHENGVWYNFMTLAAGFVPWTIFFFFSLFGLKLHKPEKSVKEILASTWNNIRSMEKEKPVQLSCIGLYNFLLFDTFQQTKRILDAGISVYCYFLGSIYIIHYGIPDEGNPSICRFHGLHYCRRRDCRRPDNGRSNRSCQDRKPVHKPSIDTGNGRVGVEYVRVSLRADNLYPDSPFGYSGDCLLSDVQEDQHQDPVCDDCIGLCH